MRLIDADRLKEYVKSIGYVPVCADCCSKRDIEKIIDEQPTAYDSDRVVEQLERYATRHDGAWYISDHAKGEMEAYKHAIEIVRRGGIDG